MCLVWSLGVQTLCFLVRVQVITSMKVHQNLVEMLLLFMEESLRITSTFKFNIWSSYRLNATFLLKFVIWAWQFKWTLNILEKVFAETKAGILVIVKEHYTLFYGWEFTVYKTFSESLQFVVISILRSYQMDVDCFDPIILISGTWNKWINCSLCCTSNCDNVFLRG